MSASYSKPITLPIWADTGLIVVPSGAKQSQGWLNTEKPPASFFNWYQNLNGNWMRWFSERFDDDEPSWRPTTTYLIGDTRTNVGNKYIVTIAGTSASSGGPTGTGTGIVDGTVTWDYVSAASPNVFLIKNPNDGTSQLRTITGGGIQIGIGLNVGFTGGSVVTNKIQVGAVGAVIGGSATGVQISNGLTVASSPFAAVSNRIQIGDVNFYLQHSATNPTFVFNGAAPFGSISFDRTAAGELQFSVAGTSRVQIRPTGMSIGFLPGSRPFEINTAATGILSATAGSFIDISTWDTANPFGVDTRLQTRIQRVVAGSLGSSAAIYLQERDGSNYNGFVGFYGQLALNSFGAFSSISTGTSGAIGFGTSGLTVTTDVKPHVVISSDKLYVGDAFFYMTRNLSLSPLIYWDSIYSNLFDRSATQWVWQNESTTAQASLRFTSSGRDLALKVAESGSVGGTSVIQVSSTANSGSAQLEVKATGTSSTALMAISSPSTFFVANANVGTGRIFMCGVTTAFSGGGSTFEHITNVGLWNTDEDGTPTVGSGTAVMVRATGGNAGGAITNGDIVIPYFAAGFVQNILNVRLTTQQNAFAIGPAQGAIGVGARGWVATHGYANFDLRAAGPGLGTNSHLADTNGGTAGTVAHVNAAAPAWMVGVPTQTPAAGVQRHLIALEVNA